MLSEVKTVTLKLLAYCRANDWAGYDPYDALNSRLFTFLPCLDFRFFRLGLTQLLKRSPVNIRPLLLVPKMQNPKALALFLMALVKLSRLGLLEQEDLIKYMVERLVALRSAGTPYWCWGYSFPWQTRTILVPRWAPNLVCTTFVANALLDAHEKSGEGKFLDMAVSAARYISDELYWTDGTGTACLAYPVPTSRARVHNANLLGAALLCRVYKEAGDKKFLDPALEVARYSGAKQRDDGSWDYGEDSTQRWIDNFHTGYNLCALRSIGRYADTSEFESHVLRGFAFYRRHFFTDDCAPRYFHDRTYPIDVHSVAQSIVTLITLKDLDAGNVEVASRVLEWAMTRLWDERGHFYYQALPWGITKVPYMRWSQAWMLYALATLLEASRDTSPASSLGHKMTRTTEHR